MNEPDLSGVHPLRVAQTRHRIAVITSFLEIEAPTTEQRLEHAKQLGVGASQFLALVRCWREHRDATRLHGAGAARGRSRDTGPRHLPAETKEMARDALRDAPGDATLAAAHALVERRLRAAGLRSPSRATVWRLMTERSRAAPLEQTGDMVVARVRLRLPVDTGDGIVFPMVTIAAAMAGGRIIAVAPADPATDLEVVAAAKTAATDQHGRVHLDERIPDGATDPAVVPTETSKARVLLVRAVGRAIGNLELRFNHRAGARPEALLTANGDMALAQADLPRVLDEAVSVHNAGREDAAGD